MYHRLPEPICSKCGSGSWERFYNAQNKGIRCLRCGHEKIEPPPAVNKAIVYRQNATKSREF